MTSHFDLGSQNLHTRFILDLCTGTPNLEMLRPFFLDIRPMISKHAYRPSFEHALLVCYVNISYGMCVYVKTLQCVSRFVVPGFST